MVLTLTVIGIGIGVGQYLGSSGVGQLFFASQSIAFVNYVHSDGTKPLQNGTETGKGRAEKTVFFLKDDLLIYHIK